MNAPRLVALILIFVLAPAFVFAEESFLLPAEGTYNDTVRLTSSQPGWSYRFLKSDRRTPHTDHFLALDREVRLDAPAGATLTYDLEVRDPSGDASVLSYTVDRTPPASPVPQPPPRAYKTSLELTFDTEPGTTVYATRGADVDGEFLALDGSVTLSGTAGKIRDYVVAAFSQDGADNRSPLGTWRYRVDRTGEIEPARDFLISPATGSFANEQLLLVETRGLTNVEYALDGADGWTVYTEPLLIRGAGDRSVAVRAHVRSTGESVSLSRTWNQRRRVPGREFASGRAAGGVTINPPRERYRYSLSDRAVSVASSVLIQSLQLNGTAGARRVYTLRLLPTDRADALEERYVFVVDRRLPPPPEIVPWNGLYAIYSLAATEYRYSNNGTPPQTVDEPVDAAGGSTLTASARFPGGAWGPEARVVVPNRALPGQPQLIGRPRLSGNRYSLLLDRPHGSIALALDGVTYSEPFSADDSGRVAFTLPRGFRSTISLRTARTAEPISLNVNLAPSAAPTIQSTGTTATITGDQPLYYRVVRNVDDAGAFSPYSGPIALDSERGLRIDYRIDAYSDPEGEPRSSIASTVVSVDQRSPNVPPFAGVENGLLTNAEVLQLDFAQSDPDLLIHYEYRTDGTTAPTPVGTSPVSGRVLRIPTEVEASQRVSLALRARFDGRETWSATRFLTVTVDRIPPAPPVVSSPASDLLSPTAVNLSFAPVEPGGSIMFRTSPTAPFTRYVQPTLLAVEPGSARTFTIDAYALDAAGNRTDMPNPRTVTIDRLAPAPPQVFAEGQPIEGNTYTSSTAVSLDLRGNDGETLFFAVRSNDQSIDPEPGLWMGAPIVFEGVESGSASYIVDAFAQDELGNVGFTRSLEVIVDTTPPEAPPPTILRTASGERGFFYWPDAPDGTVFVSIDRGDFVPFVEPIAWNVTNGPLEVLYFTEDDAGNRSTTARQRIEPSVAADAPRIAGVEDGGSYVDEVVIEALGDVPIRYSIDTSGGPATPVHALSPLLERPLQLDASLGATLGVEFRVRAFPPDGVPSDEYVYRFSIDRQPPLSPKLVGAEDNAFYPEARRVSLVPGATDDRLFYRTYALDSDPPDFVPYLGQPIDLRGREGSTSPYVIEAYAQDPGGNRSQFVERWDVVIDREIVYVDVSALPGGNGSRVTPFSDLAAAIQNASQRGRSTLLLAPGEYVLPSELFASLSGDRPFSLVGWDGTATIRADLPQLSMPPGTTLQRINMLSPLTIQAGDRPTRLESVTVTAPRGGIPAVTVAGGRTYLEEVRIITGELQSAGADIVISSSEVDRVVVEGGSLAVRDSLVYSCSTSGTAVTISGSIIEPRAVTTSEPAVSVVGGTFDITDSIVRTARGDGVLVLVANAPVRIAGSTLAIHGTTGAVALRLVESDALVERSILTATGSARVQYGLVSRDAAIRVVNSTLYASGSEESYGIAGTGGSLNVAHALVSVDGGEYARTGIAFGGESAAVVNSIILSMYEEGPAIVRRDSVPTALYFDQLVQPGRAEGNLFNDWAAFAYSRPDDTPSWRGRAYRYGVDEVGRQNRAASIGPTFGVPPIDDILAYTGRDRRSVVFAERGNWLEPPEEAVDQGVAIPGVEEDFTGRMRAGAPDAGPLELR